MSLEALLAPLPSRGTSEPCKVGRYLARLLDPYRGALVSLLTTSYADGGLSDEALSARMRDAELPVSPTILNRHRRGLCACERGDA